MKRTLALALAIGAFAPIGLIGCGEETKKVEEKKTVETPSGTSTVTDTHKETDKAK